MGNKLNIDNNLKFGKQEILLDPNVVGNKCGNEIDPLLANDIWVKKSDGNFVNLVDFITQENIRISNVEVTSSGSNVVITWSGEPTDVTLTINGSNYQPTEQGKWVGQLAAGNYNLHIQANKDYRGIDVSFTVTEPQAQELVVTYN